MKKIILGFTIGILVCGVVGVSAYTLLAKDIAYKNTNVEAAIDDLYQAQNALGSQVYSNFVGVSSSSSNNSVNLSLTKGKYICNFSYNASWINYSTSSSFAEADASNISSLISGCKTLTPLKYYYGAQGANDKSGGVYAHLTSVYGNFVCEVDTDTQITLARAGDATSAIPLTYGLTCNKIR